MDAIEDDDGTPALDVTASFRGVALDTRHVVLDPASRSSPSYRIGAARGVDAPADVDLLPSPAHTLVTATGGELRVVPTPEMSGWISLDGGRVDLADLADSCGEGGFTLPSGAEAHVACGAMTFALRATPRARALPRPRRRWDPTLHGAFFGVLALFLLLIAVAYSIPPDTRAISSDVWDRYPRLFTAIVKPPEDPESPGAEGPAAPASAPGQVHAGPNGLAGDPTSRDRNRRLAIKGPADNLDPHIGKAAAVEAIHTAGILGLLRPDSDSPLGSILSRESTIGNDAENILGNVIGTDIGGAYGAGGLGTTGTGWGGGGTSERTIGISWLGTVGHGPGPGSGSTRYGRDAGQLDRRRARVPPDVLGCCAAVRGGIDKEIVRRIIRRHVNEIRYCYEQELARSHDLRGRVSVQFTIMPTGLVPIAVVQSSTLGNARAEHCIIQAVRRWEFPKPIGGGLVAVTYPFVFDTAGGS